MTVKQITLASLIFSISFFNNTTAMDPKKCCSPSLFFVNTNNDLLGMFPAKNGLFQYPQPNFNTYKEGSIDSKLYDKVMSDVLRINFHIMQPNIQDDLPQDLQKAVSRRDLKNHIDEVNRITEENLKILNSLNQHHHGSNQH